MEKAGLFCRTRKKFKATTKHDNPIAQNLLNRNFTVASPNEALLSEIWSRKPKKGLLRHTDRGSQYASSSHRKILKEHGLKQSMSRKGNCWESEACPRGIMLLQRAFFTP